MRAFPYQDWDNLVPRTTVNLVVDTARAMRLDLPAPVTDRPFLAPARSREPGNPKMLRSQFVPFYMNCMLAIYQEQFDDWTVHNDRDLFLACIINGKTLEEVIQRGITFNKHCGMRYRLSLDAAGSDVTFSLDTTLTGSGSTGAMIDLFLVGGTYKLLSWMIGESLCATDVTIAQRKLSNTDVLNDLFDCPAHFHGQVSSITFPKTMLQKPMIRTYRELNRLVGLSPFELMPLPQPRSLSSHLEMLFRKWLVEGTQIPSMNELAERLCQSGSTLRRNLARENASFQSLVDKCREQRAIELLGCTDMTIDEISYCLGYSAPSGFTRAFKDWTGHTPSAYRHYLTNESEGLSLENALAT